MCLQIPLGLPSAPGPSKKPLQYCKVISLQLIKINEKTKKKKTCAFFTLPCVTGAPYISSEVEVTQSCPAPCDPVDYTVHGILPTTILEQVAFPFSKGSFQPRDRTQVSPIAGRFFTN